MPTAYRIAPALNLLYIAGFGHCTGAEYLNTNLEAARDPARRPGMSTIIDMHGVRELDITLDQLKAIIEADQEMAARGVYGTYRTALVVRYEMDSLVGTLYNRLVRGSLPGVQAFYSLAAAAEWIDVPDEQVEALRTALRAAWAGEPARPSPSGTTPA